jgi:hypothetical protein
MAYYPRLNLFNSVPDRLLGRRREPSRGEPSSIHILDPANVGEVLYLVFGWASSYLWCTCRPAIGSDVWRRVYVFSLSSCLCQGDLIRET